MFKIKQKSKTTLLSVLTILALSTIMPALVSAQPLANNGKDWDHVNGNSWAQNHSPQTQINSENIDELEVKWLFPLAGISSSAAVAGMEAAGAGIRQGASVPPPINDGVVYVTTNSLLTYAIDAETGAQIWEYQYAVDIEEVSERLPIAFAGGVHLHGLRFWDEGNALLMLGLACDLLAIDAETGTPKIHIEDICANVPGNQYDILGRRAIPGFASVGTWEQGNQFIVVMPGSMHSTVMNGDFRHTTMGLDIDSEEIVWRVFSFPPHGVLSKDWALQECDIGWFRDIPCSTVAAQAPENLEWDWTVPNQPPNILGGVTANWGQPVVDEDTGILYTQTGNQGPYTYIGETPGPRLYGSTIMAIDMNMGNRIWWQQPMPRDPYDYDCNWSGILADIPTLGKVYMKGCKEGRLFIIDAETGENIHMIDVTEEQYARGQITEAGTKEYPEGGVKYRTMDPLNHYDMREMVAPDGSPYCGDPCQVFPHFMNGIFQTDMTFDPNTGTLFHYTGGLQINIVNSPRPPYNIGDPMLITGGSYPANFSIVARDVVTGQEKWSRYYEGTQRAHLVSTTDILFTGFPDGFMRFYNSETGEVLREMNLGSTMATGPSIGQDSNGNQKIFVLVTAGTTMSVFGSPVPGTLVAIGLNERAAQEAVTKTVTQTSTSTTTSTSTSISSTTSTVTSEVTEEVGLSSTITYAAVAVAVIAVIGAAVLYTRKN